MRLRHNVWGFSFIFRVWALCSVASRSGGPAADELLGIRVGVSEVWDAVSS